MRFRRKRAWSDQPDPREQRMPWAGVDSMGRPMLQGGAHLPPSEVRRFR